MRPLRQVAWLVLAAAAYVAAGRLGLQVAFVHASATAVWAPSGIALAAVLLGGARVWPAVFLPAFLVNQMTAGSTASSLAIAAGNTLEALLAAHLVRRMADGLNAFERPRLVLRFAAAAMLGAAAGATVGVTSLATFGQASRAAAPAIWITWWLGDVGGALVVAPAVVLWARRPRWEEGTVRLGELGALLAAVVVCTLLVFGPLLPPGARGWPIAFLCLPPLVWAAVRFGPRETATAIVLMCAVGVAGTLQGLGPYGAVGPRLALLMLQGYTVVTGLTVLALAAAVDEQERTHRLVRHRDAQALAEAQALAHVGSWTWEVGADHVTWSHELYRIFGIEPGTRITYESFLDAIHAGDRERVDQVVRHALASGEPFAFDHRVVRGDRSERWLHGRGSVVMGPDGPVRMLGTAQDITERRRAEEASRAFLANAAHELRTPLTTVMGLTDLIAGLGRSIPHPLLEEYCDRLRAQGLRARRLISGLLDVSRMEQGLLEVALEAVPVEETVRRAADALAQGKDRALHLEVPPGLCVLADPLRLDEALVNLLQNAFAHGGP
ncbi:MAG TPA: MASE1 domain-containing protein, partial [Vicinamibacteria bacterium]|nr:MASE1 domain-containing protein [Vicinamibacteria bacterium]